MAEPTFTAGDPATIGAPVPPETLSDTAAALYRTAAAKQGSALDVTAAEHADAVAEICDANLGSCYWYSGDYKPGEGSLSIVRLHPLYFVADGSGSLTVQLHTGERRMGTQRLVAHIAGAELTRANGDNHLERRLVSRHRTLTDGEHDSTILVDATIDLVTFVDAHHRGTELRGVLTELRAWPLGAELVEPGQEIRECSYCADRPDTGDHHLGAYIAPERPELRGVCGQPITITISHRPECHES